MGESAVHAGDTVILERRDFQALLDALRAGGFHVVGPTLRDGAIAYGEVARPEDLPAGWTDAQDGGTYRLVRRQDEALFGYAVGPQSWKRFLFPPALRLWRARRAGAGFAAQPEPQDAPRLAFLGVRPCELHAIAIQDRVLLPGPHADPGYRARREAVFLVAVNCGQPGGTCFCASMNTGPKATRGFDLALTEVVEAARHYFVVQAGSPAGAEVLGQVPVVPAGPAERDAAEATLARAAGQMGRRLETADLPHLLEGNPDHPRWHEVAARCLTCGNCTLVCPTCFCTAVEDTSDLAGGEAERWRRWDSCFTLEFSYIHGGSIRATAKARYRQWLTHKLGTWVEQFGTSGCVGCGRCITWCPVGIDITEEVRAIRQAPPPAPPATAGG